MKSILLPVAVITVAAGLVGYLLAYFLLRPRKGQQIGASSPTTAPVRPEERYEGDIFSPRGRRIYFFILCYPCLYGWFFLVRWWVGSLEAWPNGGMFLMTASEGDLQYAIGVPIAVCTTVIVTFLIWRLFAPGAYSRYRRSVVAEGGVNGAAAHPIAALVIILALGCFAGLKLTCYTRFDSSEMLFRPPWHFRTKVYPYSRVRLVLQQLRRDNGEKAKRFAIVFDDGQVWFREDYGSPDKDVEGEMKFICKQADPPQPFPEEVESIEAEIERVAQERNKPQGNE